jgi:hypothetical protein
MFTMKDGYGFGELGRRGLESVREELLEKVIAYNLCLIILIRKRHMKKHKRAACRRIPSIVRGIAARLGRATDTQKEPAC